MSMEMIVDIIQIMVEEELQENRIVVHDRKAPTKLD